MTTIQELEQFMFENKEDDLAKSFRKILSDKDYLSFLRSCKITKTLFVTGGDIESVGSSTNPWRNNVTVYSDGPSFTTTYQKILEIDPECMIELKQGWTQEKNRQEIYLF